jgi:hypothetical protein
MKAIDIYTVEPVGEAARSRLLNTGMPTTLIVPGRVLEAQFAAPAGVVLFITHDIPFEERLDILLVREDVSIADQVSLWGSLTTGNFRNVSISGPRSICFDFFGTQTWEVTLLPRATFRLPGRCDPAGVHRPAGLRRQLIVEPTTRSARPGVS